MGISVTLAVFLNELDPSLKLSFREVLSSAAQGEFDRRNNVGTCPESVNLRRGNFSRT
jgi:hypothetical protein